MKSYKGQLVCQHLENISRDAKAVRGMPSNGWVWWKYERAPGDWVLLDELRKK